MNSLFRCIKIISVVIEPFTALLRTFIVNPDVGCNHPFFQDLNLQGCLLAGSSHAKRPLLIGRADHLLSPTQIDAKIVQGITQGMLVPRKGKKADVDALAGLMRV